MAQRRMFSPDIVDSDAFLDMPASSQLLYFHLGVRADDDGFISPKKVTRLIGANEDDIKVLIGKRFLIPFDNGVVVIKHWLIHNLIRKDRYKETRYVEEKKLLKIKENGSYTELGCQNDNQFGNQMAPQVRLGKVSIGKNINTNTNTKSAQHSPSARADDTGAVVNRLIKLFEPINPSYEKLYANATQRKALERLVKKFGEDKVASTISALPGIITQKYAPQITTPLHLEDKLGALIAFVAKNAEQPLTSV